MSAVTLEIKVDATRAIAALNRMARLLRRQYEPLIVTPLWAVRPEQRAEVQSNRAYHAMRRHELAR